MAQWLADGSVVRGCEGLVVGGFSGSSVRVPGPSLAGDLVTHWFEDVEAQWFENMLA